MTLDCRITIADSWFFRQARAHDAVGVGQIDSLFPPSVSTLTGALRTALGDSLDVDWQAFGRGQADPQMQALLGSGDNLGLLKVRGPYLVRATDCQTDERLYPVPAALLKYRTANYEELHRLTIGRPLRCDMGEVAMPDFTPRTPAGSKTMTDDWISSRGLGQWLSGQIPDVQTLSRRCDVIEYESRLGIARNNRQATVQEGMLYQTRHIRLKDVSLSLSLQLEGLPDDLETQLTNQHASLRFGGEGREAGLSWCCPGDFTVPVARSCEADGLILYLATPALISGGMLPDFTPIHNEAGRVCCWEGIVAGLRLRLVSAASYRQQRLGGWDMKARAPKPLRSLTAAGSVFYCELIDPDVDAGDAVNLLTGCQVGDLQTHGYGELLAGFWPSPERTFKV